MENKIVMVTGGASGLGLAIVQALVAQQSTVIVFDLNQSALALLDASVDCYHVDVTDEEAVELAVAQVMQKHGRIDVLVNNAGIIYSRPLINIMDPQQMRHSYQMFKKVIDVDLNSVFLMTSMVAQQMILKRTQGSIINISSICAQGQAGQTAYAAAKAGVESMTKVWAKELAAFGIRANAIAPGFIDTQSTTAALNEVMIKDIKSRTPLKVLGQVEHIVLAVRYAIENKFVNGAILAVNGGLVV